MQESVLEEAGNAVVEVVHDPSPAQGDGTASAANQSHFSRSHSHLSSLDGSKSFFSRICGHETYRLPRKVVIDSLETLDGKDSPDRPGLLLENTLRGMVQRLDELFGSRDPKRRAAQVDSVVRHLHRHTRRRRGNAVLEEGLLEWEHTSWVHQLFQVELNVFEQIFFTIDVSYSTSTLSKWCSAFIVLVILLSIILWMVSTLPAMQDIPKGCTSMEVGDCSPEPHEIFEDLERLSVYIFTLEYVLRLCTVHSVRFELQDASFLHDLLTGKEDSCRMMAEASSRSTGSSGSAGGAISPPAQLDGKLKTAAKFVFAPANMVDLLSILPYWWEFVTNNAGSSASALMVLRILRLTRVFRIFRLGQYNEAFVLFTRVMHQSTTALSLMVLFIVLDCCLFGTLIWFAEQGDWYPQGHPELLNLSTPILDRGAFLRSEGGYYSSGLEESPFSSIVHSFWYVIVTITTVGYGDVYPTTLWGKMVGFVTILNGIVVLAMPVGVVGANFSAEYYRVIDDRKRRVTLQQQIKTMNAVEEEQDKALQGEFGQVDEDKGKPRRKAMQLADTTRQLILEEAKKLDAVWHSRLPQEVQTRLSLALRQFVFDLLSAEHHEEESVEGEEELKARPPALSVMRLHELDHLTAKVHGALAEMTSTDFLADFGLKEAFDCRRQWAAFSDRCWNYAMEQCQIVGLSDPPPLITHTQVGDDASPPEDELRTIADPEQPRQAKGLTSLLRHDLSRSA